MCKIDILFRDRSFEHDIYELTRAFYPGSTMRSLYPEEQPGRAAEPEEEPDLFLEVWREPGRYLVRYRSTDAGEGLREAEMAEEPEKDAFNSARAEKHAAGIPEPEAAGAEKHAAGIPEPENTGADGPRSSGPPEERRRQLAVRKQNKDRLKYMLYQLLVSLTGRELPWGNLTGIRPVKLATGLMEAGYSNPQIARELRERYLVSPGKTAMAVTIANREKEILKDVDYRSGYSLYVGIPFCPSICLYCSFSSNPLSVWKNRVDEYLQALRKEIFAAASMMKETGRHLDTLYIGGGTPTTLEPDQLRFLLSALEEAFGYEGLLEFTLEAGRPDSIDPDKLKAIREYPVTRISVNPQTMNQETLDIIGRKHTVLQTEEAFLQAREQGFDNINMDLIVGLPGEDISMVQHTLEKIRELSPDSLTIHSLAVKRAARLNIFRDRYAEMSFENNQEIMDLTMRTAYEMGMGPYYLYRQKNMKGNFENVGYAKEGKAGIYNILIMEEKQPIIALGAGGACKLVCDGGTRVERIENVKDVKSYLERTDEMIERKRHGIAACLLS